jgi:hypothetical protein
MSKSIKSHAPRYRTAYGLEQMFWDVKGCQTRRATRPASWLSQAQKREQGLSQGMEMGL